MFVLRPSFCQAAFVEFNSNKKLKKQSSSYELRRLRIGMSGKLGQWLETAFSASGIKADSPEWRELVKGNLNNLNPVQI